MLLFRHLTFPPFFHLHANAPTVAPHVEGRANLSPPHSCHGHTVFPVRFCLSVGVLSWSPFSYRYGVVWWLLVPWGQVGAGSLVCWKIPHIPILVFGSPSGVRPGLPISLARRGAPSSTDRPRSSGLCPHHVAAGETPAVTVTDAGVDLRDAPRPVGQSWGHPLPPTPSASAPTAATDGKTTDNRPRQSSSLAPRTADEAETRALSTAATRPHDISPRLLEKSMQLTPHGPARSGNRRPHSPLPSPPPSPPPPPTRLPW